jgi:hypothetical protein
MGLSANRQKGQRRHRQTPFVLLSIRKRIRLWGKIALFDLSANEDRKVAVGFVFAPN